MVCWVNTLVFNVTMYNISTFYSEKLKICKFVDFNWKSQIYFSLKSTQLFLVMWLTDILLCLLPIYLAGYSYFNVMFSYKHAFSYMLILLCMSYCSFYNFFALLSKVFETRNPDDLTEEWLKSHLSFFRWMYIFCISKGSFTRLSV